MVIRRLENCLTRGSDKIRFENCVNNLGNPQYVRVIRGHASGEKLDAKLKSLISQFYMDGETFCIILDLHTITSPSRIVLTLLD